MNEKTDNKFVMSVATVKVKARGYWFSLGGGKTSFGYYPHLRRDALPVYPDTQIRGDLLMAARWLKNLGVIDNGLVERVFGKRGNPASGLLYTTDLELDPDEWEAGRFQVKPRVQIKPDTGTVEEHMLVNIETAYLDGLWLTAKIYIGYCAPDEEEKARNLIEQSFHFLSGFGAFRSRGYGRCENKFIKWESVEVSPTDCGVASKDYCYYLESLVPLRNKVVNTSPTTLLRTRKYLDADQIRGWFVRAYNRLYGAWPRPEEMAALRFTTAYPSERDTLGFPAPMSTLQEKTTSEVIDTWNTSAPKKEEEPQKDEEPRKPKPLLDSQFVTDSPSVIEVRTGNRVRNSMDESFLTLDKGGLFVQEYVGKGTRFGCRITIDPDGKEGFARKARFILENIKPEISGAIFDPELKEVVNRPSESNTQAPRIVLDPIPFSDVTLEDEHPYEEINRLVTRPSAEVIRIEARRHYNTMLRRPRRNRIVIGPGSILLHDGHRRTVPWSGFGQTIRNGTVELSSENDRPVVRADTKTLKITDSQAGFLRELLYPNLPVKEFQNLFSDRIKKLEKNKNSKNKNKHDENIAPKDVFVKLKECLKSDSTGSTMREYIKTLLHGHVMQKWERESEKVKERLKNAINSN